MSEWRTTWRQSPTLTELELTVPRGDYGEFGLADFPAGTTPACSRHGAMNRVTDERDWWRCLACNIGCEWKRGGDSLMTADPVRELP